MTLQQMQYILALDKYRHFVLAAEACGVTQPTMSVMIQKLEEELGVKIFDRTNKLIQPTVIGKKIIAQAEVALREAGRVKELVNDEIGELTGKLKMAIIPTISPYIVPSFIYHFKQDCPKVSLEIEERSQNLLYEEILRGHVDFGISTAPLDGTDLLEIPLYHERFWAYFSPKCNPHHPVCLKDMDTTHMWVLREGHCLKSPHFKFCLENKSTQLAYQAGSNTTLIQIVDKNDGYTIIPEMHLPLLTEEQKKNIIPLVEPDMATRTVSILIRPDFVRERMLNAVASIIKKIVPANLIDERLKKFAIKL